MRRRTLITLGLFFLSLAILITLPMIISASRNTVDMELSHTQGDISALSGLKADMKFISGSHLLWDAEFTPSSGLNPKVQFSYSSEGYRAQSEHGQHIEIYGMSNTGVSSSGSVIHEDDTDELSRIVRDVGSRTENGTTHEEKVLLKNYCDYLPITIDFALDGKIVVEGDEGRDVQLVSAHGLDVHRDMPLYEAGLQMKEFFRIPVPEDYVVSIEVTKNQGGVINGYGFTSAMEPIDFNSPHIVGEKGVYFSLMNYSSYPLDYSLIPGGLGIYYIPLRVLKEFETETPGSYDIQGAKFHSNDRYPDETIVLIDELSNIYSMDPASRVLGLSLNEEETQLRLCIWEGDRLKMVLIDLSSHEVLRELDLMPWNEKSDLVIEEEADFFVIMDYFDRLVLLEEDEEGLPRLALDIPISPEDPVMMERYYTDLSMAWNGEYLAVGHYMFVGDYNYQSTSPRFAVYGQDGLVCIAEYRNAFDGELLASGKRYLNRAVGPAREMALSWE